MAVAFEPIGLLPMIPHEPITPNIRLYINKIMSRIIAAIGSWSNASVFQQQTGKAFIQQVAILNLFPHRQLTVLDEFAPMRNCRVQISQNPFQNRRRKPKAFVAKIVQPQLARQTAFLAAQ